jgi:tetratricopeptide (TPR) repeat protein
VDEQAHSGEDFDESTDFDITDWDISTRTESAVQEEAPQIALDTIPFMWYQRAQQFLEQNNAVGAAIALARLEYAADAGLDLVAHYASLDFELGVDSALEALRQTHRDITVASKPLHDSLLELTAKQQPMGLTERQEFWYHQTLKNLREGSASTADKSLETLEASLDGRDASKILDPLYDSLAMAHAEQAGIAEGDAYHHFARLPQEEWKPVCVVKNTKDEVYVDEHGVAYALDDLSEPAYLIKEAAESLPPEAFTHHAVEENTNNGAKLAQLPGREDYLVDQLGQVYKIVGQDELYGNIVEHVSSPSFFNSDFSHFDRSALEGEARSRAMIGYDVGKIKQQEHHLKRAIALGMEGLESELEACQNVLQMAENTMFPLTIATLKAGEVDPAVHERQLKYLVEGSTLAQNFIGQLYEGQNNPEQARAWYEKAIQTDPSDAYSHIHLMRMTDKNKLDESMKAFQEATNGQFPADKLQDMLSSPEFVTGVLSVFHRSQSA